MQRLQDDDQKILLNDDHISSLAESVERRKKSQVGIYVKQQQDDKDNESSSKALLNTNKKRPQTGHGLLNDNLDGNGPNGKSVFQDSVQESSYEDEEEKLEVIASLNSHRENNFEKTSKHLLEIPKVIPLDDSQKNDAKSNLNFSPQNQNMKNSSIDWAQSNDFSSKNVVQGYISDFKEAKTLLEKYNQQISKQDRRQNIYNEDDENSKNLLLDGAGKIMKVAKDVLVRDQKFYEQIDLLKDYQYMSSTHDVIELKTKQASQKKKKKKNLEFFNGNSFQENDANVFFNLNFQELNQKYGRSESVVSLQVPEKELEQDEEKPKEQTGQDIFFKQSCNFYKKYSQFQKLLIPNKINKHLLGGLGSSILDFYQQPFIDFHNQLDDSVINKGFLNSEITLDQVTGELHLAVVIDQQFDVEPSSTEIKDYQLELQAKHEKDMEETALRKLEEEQKAEATVRIDLKQDDSDCNSETKNKVEDKRLKNCRLRRLLKYRLEDDQFKQIDEILLECSINKLGMPDWEHKYFLSPTNFDIVMHNNSTYFFYPVAPPPVVVEELQLDLLLIPNKKASVNNSPSPSTSQKNIPPLNLPVTEEQKHDSKLNESGNILNYIQGQEEHKDEKKDDLKIKTEVDIRQAEQNDTLKIIKPDQKDINSETHLTESASAAKLEKIPEILSSSTEDIQKEGGSPEKVQVKQLLNNKNLSSQDVLQRPFSPNNTIQSFLGIPINMSMPIEPDDNIPQMTLMLYKHISWPKVIPNCYSESPFASEWMEQHQGTGIFKMEQYQLKIPKNWPLRQPELGVMGLQVLFLINPENLDYAGNKERDYEFLDQQYVVVRQKASAKNWQGDNLLVYSLKNPEEPLIQIEEQIYFGVLQAGFVFKNGEKGELTFVFQCSTIGTSYTCQIQYVPGQTVKDALKVKKYNVNLIEYAYINALRRPNQIQTKEVYYYNEQGAEKLVKTTFYLGGFNDITDPVVLFPLYEEQNDRDKLKSAISSSYPIKGDSKVISFTSAKDGGFPIFDDGKLNQLLRHITPPELRKEFCDPKVFSDKLYSWDIVICSNNRIILINEFNVLQWWIKDTIVTSLKNEMEFQENSEEDEQFDIQDLQKGMQPHFNLENCGTYKVVLQQFNNQNKLNRLQLQRNENNNINKNLTLGRVHKGVIYGHHDLWIIKSKPSQQDFIPCLSVKDNFLLLDLEQNKNGFLSIIRLFPDDQLNSKYGIRLIKFQVSHQAARAIFFFEKRPGFKDPNNTDRNVGVVFFISETILKLKEIAEKLKKSNGGRGAQNSESLLQKSTTVFIMFNLKDLRYFRYEDGIKNFSSIFENEKKTKIELDEYLGLMNHTEFEPITDCNQPSTSEMVIPFYFNDQDPNEGRRPFFCFFNIYKLEGLISKEKNSIPSPNESDSCETRRLKNWFIDQGIIMPLKLGFYQKTLQPNFEAENKFYSDRSSLEPIKRGQMITRSSPWSYNTIKVGKDQQKVWQATYSLAMCLCKSDYSIREQIVTLSDQCKPVFQLNQQQIEILGLKNQDQEERKNFVKLQPIKICLIARTQQTDNLPSNLYCNDILIPKFNNEGTITQTNLILCTSFSSLTPQKCIPIEKNYESIDFPDEKTKLKMIAWYENNLLNHPVIVNTINEDKTIKDRYLDGKIWNKAISKGSQKVFTDYEIVPLEIETMNKFSSKIQQGGYKHIRFTDSLKKQLSVVSANLTKDIIINEAFEDSEQAYLIFHTLRQILSMSQANFGDFYTGIYSQEKEMASHLFQPRFIHAGLSLCTLELKNMLKNTQILYNALNWDPNSDDFKQDKYTYLRNSVVSQFANLEDYVLPYNLNRFFDFQSGFNYQTLIQLSIDSNMLKPAVVIVDFLMEQTESIDITFQTVMTDFPQLLSNDKIDIISFLNRAEDDDDQPAGQSQEEGKKQTSANLMIDLVSESLPALGAPENVYMKCKIDTLFNPIPQAVNALLTEIEKEEKAKKEEETEANSSDIRVEFHAMIFLHTNVKMKIDVFTNRQASENINTEYLNNKYWKDLTQVAVSDLFMAELIANQDNPEFFTSRAIKAIIVKQFDKKSGAYVTFLCYFYLFGFVLTYSLTILLRASFEHAEDNPDVLYIIRVLTIISLITQIIFFSFEVVEMLHKDFKTYFLDPWNYSDCLQIFFFLAHEGLRFTYPNIDEDIHAKATDGLLQVFTLFQVFLKVLQFMRSFPAFQPLIQMQVQVFSDIKPFLLIFFLLIYSFSLITFALDADFNKEDYPGLPKVLYTIIRIFRNSIGDIEVPKYDKWLNITFDPETNKEVIGPISSAQGISIFVIYLYWIVNIFIMVIILLNFLIAEVGGTFENVKGEIEPLQYKNKSEQNLLIYKLDKIFRKPLPAQVWVFKCPVKQVQEKSEIKELQSNVFNLITSSSKNIEKEISEKIKLRGQIQDNLTKELSNNFEIFKQNMEEKINKIEGALQTNLESIDIRMAKQELMLQHQFNELQKAMIEAIKK